MWRAAQVIVAVLVLAGALLAGTNAPSREAAGDGLERLAIASGFTIDQIAITGFRHTLLADIMAALALDPGQSSLSFDPVAARERLVALPWVEEARIGRVLPAGLSVVIAEREPFAVWQNRQLLFLIDKAGRTLEPVAPSEHRTLPLVVGEGAAEHAREIVELIAREPIIAERFVAAVRIGDRRWRLKLDNAPDLELSAEDPAASLAEAVRLHREERLFDRAITAVDLRVPGRVVLRLADGAAALMAERRRASAAVRRLGEAG
jgi:cell division protein FtsQ